MTKRFHSIEYRDDEGEIVVRHAFMTQIEVEKLLQEFTARKILVTIYDLTPEQVDTASVLSGDAQSRQMGKLPGNCLK